MSQQIVSLLHHSSSPHVIAVTADHNLVFVDVPSMTLIKTLVGNNDDIIDVKYIPSSVLDGSTSRKVAIATNSEQLRLFDVDTFDTHLLAGHAEAILALDVSPDGQFVATVSKDKTARCVGPASALSRLLHLLNGEW